MPIYILLSRVTQRGVQTLQRNPGRLQEVNRDVEELGAKVLHQWATLGEWDFINVVEAPDTATIAKVSVALGARGSTRIETLEALSIADFIAAISKPRRAGPSRPRPRLKQKARRDRPHRAGRGSAPRDRPP